MLLSLQALENEVKNIEIFIYNTVKNAGFTRVIIGLSGGIDSALSATLCKKALGCENVYGVMIPYKTSHPDSLNHAKILAESVGIKYEIVDITPMADAYLNNCTTNISPLRKGNLMARLRMCVLYDLSALYQSLVVGTGNKSEIYTGYCTQYGDSACAFEPIAHLYKTQVIQMAKMLCVPSEIVDKPPSADLWEGQTDEGELGISYSQLDKILYLMIDEKRDKDYLLKQGISKHEIDLVINKIKSSAFKRRLPLTIADIWEA